MATPYPIRNVDASGVPAFEVAIMRAFGDSLRESLLEVLRKTDEPDRTLAAYDGEEVVGTAAAYSLEMTTPGGTARPFAAVTAVSVTATHRRRGILTALMRRQLEDVMARGTESFAALWASEPVIYQRFGYGLASWRQSLDVDLAHTSFSPEGTATLKRFSGRLRMVERPRADPLVAQVHEAVRPLRTGALSRPEAHWGRLLWDEPGKERQIVVAESAAGMPVGYGIFRLEEGERAGFSPSGVVQLTDVVGVDPAAYAALWRFLLDLDLRSRLRARNRPLPDPVAHLLTDHRRLNAAVSEALWVRLLDVPRALAERCFAAPVDLVLDVTDAFLPAVGGCFRVVVDGPGRPATVTRVDAAPDLSMGVVELGAAHLGGTSLADLALAGRVVEHTTGALAAAASAWSWSPAPFCAEVF